MRVTLRYLIHANSASAEDHLPEGWSSSALPPTAIAEVLSSLPTYHDYMNKSDEYSPAYVFFIPRISFTMQAI